MKFKTIFFALLVAVCFTTAGNYNEATANAPALSTAQTLCEDDYTYVYNEVDGVMWVYVYDKEGNLVTAYPED